MIVTFATGTLPVSRWQNGRGETREICCVGEPGQPFVWRASIATVAGDGAFSRYPGIDRTIVLLSGAPFWLRGDGIAHRLTLHAPWTFSGERALCAEAVSAPGLDFNLMTRRGQADGEVTLQQQSVALASAGVALVLGGRWQTPGGTLTEQQGLCWQRGASGELRPESPDARLLLAIIRLSRDR
ncbi:HutD family protein [Pantoea sp. 1.19]|uniref:HutD/Ves family protein n=1 Tax=Pantoea sp. 1.19 TaxID=1925589 RepID=UPI000948AEAF|nr:HutD family protein [Pantoea sp. 1.19]